MRTNPCWLIFLASAAASAQPLHPPEDPPAGLLTIQQCDTLDVVVTLNSRFAATMRSVSLDSATNMWLDYPAAPDYGDTTFFYRVTATDRKQEASGTLVFTDRAFNSVRIPYHWSPPATTGPAVVTIEQNISAARDTALTLTNAGSTTDTILAIRLSKAESCLSLNSIPEGPHLLAPGTSMSFGLRCIPSNTGTVNDTILVFIPCKTLRIPVNVAGMGMVSVEWGGSMSGVRLMAAPNPVKERAFITLQNFSASTNVDILNNEGRLIQRLMENGDARESTTLEWSSNGLPAGVYYCVVQTAQGRQSTPIMVTH